MQRMETGAAFFRLNLEQPLSGSRRGDDTRTWSGPTFRKTYQTRCELCQYTQRLARRRLMGGVRPVTVIICEDAKLSYETHVSRWDERSAR